MVVQEPRLSAESDIAVIADLQSKGRAFLDALEAARPAIERLRLAAVRGHSTAGVLARVAAHELDSLAVNERTLDEFVDMAMSREQKSA
jgi:hypothetical protein